MDRSMSKQQGFTLVEVIIAVAVLGILAAIAVPSYQSYTLKANFSEVMMAAEGYKVPVAECVQMQDGDRTGCSAGNKGIPDVPATLPARVAGISITDGVIRVDGTAEVGSYAWQATAELNGEYIHWAQSGSCFAAGLCR